MGSITLPYAAPVLSPKLWQRLAELDATMELSKGHDVAEVVLGDPLQSYLAGRDSHMADGWEFDNPERSRRRLAALDNRWRRADGTAHFARGTRRGFVSSSPQSGLINSHGPAAGAGSAAAET